ncbi:MAG TPA: DUF3662 and FHA domain-containing protein [Dermatophilaceae bacterium]|nr:DUF3662 and FHA domain-containing protein [Dermatophilaceae bacterium]
MGLFDRVERKLESVVNGAFARAFKAEVQPVEIASAMRRAMDDRAAVVSKGRTIVPNHFTVELAAKDYQRLITFEGTLITELVASVEEHAESQRLIPGGPLQVEFVEHESLETGVFRVRADTATAPATPGHAGRESRPPESGRSQSADPPAHPDPYNPDEPDHPRRRIPPRGRFTEAASPAEGAAGMASHAAIAAESALAGTVAARDAQLADAPRDDPLAVLDDPAAPPEDVHPHAGDPRGAEPRAATPRSPRPEAAFEPTRAEAVVTPPTAPAPPVTPVERPWLDVDGDSYPLLAAITVVGRDASADITLDDPGISRQHCEIRVTHDGPHLRITVRDLSSTNGTFVNGERISSQHVEAGDRLTLGRMSLHVRTGRR